MTAQPTAPKASKRSLVARLALPVLGIAAIAGAFFAGANIGAVEAIASFAAAATTTGLGAAVIPTVATMPIVAASATIRVLSADISIASKMAIGANMGELDLLHPVGAGT